MALEGDELTANLKDQTNHELFGQMLAQQIKTNELLRAMLTQFQHTLPINERDKLASKLGVRQDE